MGGAPAARAGGGAGAPASCRGASAETGGRGCRAARWVASSRGADAPAAYRGAEIGGAAGARARADPRARWRRAWAGGAIVHPTSRAGGGVAEPAACWRVAESPPPSSRGRWRRRASAPAAARRMGRGRRGGRPRWRRGAASPAVHASRSARAPPSGRRGSVAQAAREPVRALWRGGAARLEVRGTPTAQAGGSVGARSQPGRAAGWWPPPGAGPRAVVLDAAALGVARVRRRRGTGRAGGRSAPSRRAGSARSAARWVEGTTRPSPARGDEVGSDAAVRCATGSSVARRCRQPQLSGVPPRPSPHVERWWRRPRRRAGASTCPPPDPARCRRGHPGVALSLA